MDNCQSNSIFFHNYALKPVNYGERLSIITIESTSSDICLACDTHVRPRQEALACDNCGRWQHRGTGEI